MSALKSIPAVVLTLFAGQLSLAHGSHGDENKVIEKIEQAQDTIGNMNPTPAAGYCQNCDLSGQTHTPAAQMRLNCVLDICKNRSSATFDTEDEVTKLQEEIRKTKIAVDPAALTQALKDSFNAKWEKELSDLGERQRALHGPTNISDENKAIMQTFLGLSYLRSVSLNQSIDGPLKISTKVDVEKTKEKNPDITDEEIKQATPLVEDIFNRLMNADLVSTVYSADVYLKFKYPDKNRLQAYQEEVKALQQQHEKLRSSKIAMKRVIEVGLEKDMARFMEKSFETDSDFDDKRFTELLNATANMELYHELFTPGSILNKKSADLKIEKLLTFENVKKRWDENSRLLNGIFQNHTLRANLEKIYITRCLASFAIHNKVLPSDAEIERAKKASLEVIEKVETQVLSKFSEHTKKATLKELKDTYFQFPLSKTRYSNEFKRNLAQKTKSNSERTTLDPNVTKAISLTPYVKDPEKDIVSFVDESCGPLQIPAFTDTAFNHLGAIKVGWGTIRDLETGKIVMAHELGHRLDNIFKNIKMSGESQKKYNEVNTCLAQRHTDNEGRAKGQYIDEDWGDLVAAGISDKDTRNFKCGTTRWNLNELDSLSLVNSNKDSKHSSDYFRLIQFERNLGRELPESCTKAVNQERPGFLDSPVCKITAE